MANSYINFFSQKIGFIHHKSELIKQLPHQRQQCKMIDSKNYWYRENVTSLSTSTKNHKRPLNRTHTEEFGNFHKDVAASDADKETTHLIGNSETKMTTMRGVW